MKIPGSGPSFAAHRIAAAKPAPCPNATLSASQSSARSSDEVELTEGKPWAELRSLGILGATATIAAPLGSLISETARQGLEQMFERLDAQGYEFSLKGKDEKVSHSEALESVLKSPPNDLTLGNLHHHDLQSYLYFQKLDHLRFIDAVTEGSAVLTDAEQELQGFIDKVRQQGQNLNLDDDHREQVVDSRILLERLSRENTVYFHPDGDSSAKKIRNENDRRAIDFFYYDGEAEGLDDPDFARALKGLEGRGWHIGDEKNRNSPYYRFAFKERDDTFLLYRGGRFQLPVTATTITNLDSLEKELDELEAAFPKIMDPVLNKHGKMSLADDAAYHVLATDGKFSPTVRLAVYADLHDAVMEGRGHQDHQFSRMQHLLKDMVNRAKTPYELGLYTEAVKPMLRESGVPAIRAAQAHLEKLDELFAFEADSQDQERFLKLTALCGSFAAARETDTLLAIASPENPAEGMALANRLGRWLSPETSTELPLHLRTLMARKLPAETLESASGRYEKLLRLLAARDHQSQAPTLFTQLQRAAGGDQAEAERLTTACLQGLTGDDEPLEALRRVLDPPDEVDFELDEDVIVIGGVPLTRD